jgi:hypothetical protein
MAGLRLKKSQFQQAQPNVEATYFIRLYAEFEGILSGHLTSNHPVVNVPEKPKWTNLSTR